MKAVTSFSFPFVNLDNCMICKISNLEHPAFININEILQCNKDEILNYAWFIKVNMQLLSYNSQFHHNFCK